MKWKKKDIYYWINSFDPDEYARTHIMPKGMPLEIASFIQKIFHAANSSNSSDLLQQQTQYSALQSQINPHFLYNTLECIRSEALFNKQQNIADMTENLSRFFRYCISSRGDFVTLQDEIVNLKQYFFIQQYRFGNRFSLDIQLENDSVLQCHMPKMTLQPLVENAIYHGLEQKKGKGAITLRVTMTEKKLYIWVSDNGIGMTSHQVDEINNRILHPDYKPYCSKRHSGIALTNVNARIQLHFGKEYGLRVMSVLHKGTDVEIVLPYYDDLEFSSRFLQEEL